MSTTCFMRLAPLSKPNLFDSTWASQSTSAAPVSTTGERAMLRTIRFFAQTTKPLFAVQAITLTAIPKAWQSTSRTSVVPYQPPVVKATLTNMKQEALGELTLPYQIFAAPIRPDILHRVIVWSGFL